MSDPYALLLSGFLALIALWIAIQAGFFKFPSKASPFPIPFLQLLGAFTCYFLVALLLFPGIYFLISYWVTGAGGNGIPVLKGWIQLIFITILLITLLAYALFVRRSTFTYILWRGRERTRKRFTRSIGMGLLSLIVSYPVMLFVSSVLSSISIWLFNESGVEQAAVNQLKATKENPVLFTFMALAIVTIVPFIEEFLFRGYIQNWLRGYLGRVWAIVVTSTLFAVAHFSMGQGIGNFELIGSLFVLSCFIGFIYEREQTLWAPMAQHACFNLVSSIAILFN